MRRLPRGDAAPRVAAKLPLLAERDLAAPIAWRGGHAISGAAFLDSAARLAERLPVSGRAINLCQDRLHFALGLAAALQRGHSSLMPPNALPATLRQLPAAGAPPYVLADPGFDEAQAAGLPVVRVSFDEAGASNSQPERKRASIAQPERFDAAVPRIDADLAAVVLLTSGSTGAPQPHGKQFGPLPLNITAVAARLAEWLGRPSLHGLTIIATVPPQHSYGLESSVLLALLGGASLDAGRPFYPADIAAALAAVPRPRALVTTPFHLKALVQSGVTLPAVDLVLSATAPLSPQLAAQAERAMGALLGEIYGCTEAGQVAARLTTQGETWTTLGELRIAREAGAEGDGSDGGERFVVSGGHVAEPTPLADVLVLHDERHFRLLGRANDLIHVAGKRSSLAHLNFHLNRIEGVEDGAFWLPEAGDLPVSVKGGPAQVEAVLRPIAFVVAPRLTSRQVIAALRRELEPAFVPRRVVHVDALPREATGKLTVGALRTWALTTLAAAAPAAGASPPPATTDEYTIDAAHRAFAGHFPGHPLLPGVVLLSLVMRSLRRWSAWRAWLGGNDAALAIEQVKFLAPVGPGERVRVHLDALERDVAKGVAFECRSGAAHDTPDNITGERRGRVIARGVLGAGRAP
ncbi:MAG: AMP-binding protein [Burkholderiaceae bacterium]|nr:AMP-binding protein [Burkholderiaceae bacterium]